jgi:hypothetical protein
MLKAERIEVETSWKSTYATSFAINEQRKMGLKGPASLIGSWNLPISLERIKPFMIPIDHGGKRHRKSNSLSFRQSFKPNEGSNLGAAHRKQSTIQSQPMFGKQEPQLLVDVVNRVTCSVLVLGSILYVYACHPRGALPAPGFAGCLMGREK